uniref:Ribonuclease Oy-like n=1 Tax=Crassostrea virginica TaxID=6565 RepID=A0A8B8E3X7_CRAVI|nr:ribonuclease Oy-like [Crassostrea virginica]
MKMARFLVISIVFLFGFINMCTAKEWSYFTFAQQWPLAVCTEHDPCVIPPSMVGWGIHGLWPSADSLSKGPENCNKSWPFDIKSIESLVPELKKYWPNLYPDTKENSFWEHEWEKHGTCATSVPATSNELKYFQMGLMLHAKYNITKILMNQGILPSNTARYMTNETESALKRELGVEAMIECAYDKKKTQKQLLYEVFICMNKDFKLIDCNREGESQTTCPKHEPFFYPPLHPDQPMIDISVI